MKILVKLPIRPLIPLKCISRRCHSLILNPQFIRSQLHGTNMQKPYFSTRVLTNNNPLQSLPIESLTDPNVEGAPVPTVLELPTKVPQSFSVNIVGSCNGLVCLYVSGKGLLLLLNPTTGEWRELPSSKFAPSNGLLFYGFGYDSQTDDYKLVWGNRVGLKGGSNSTHTIIEIYSLRTDSWRCLSETIEFKGPGNGLYASGGLHWLTSRSESEPISSIISFDLSEEKFHEAVPMNGISDHESVPLDGLVITGERFFIYRRLMTHFEVWVLKQDDKETSWTKLYTIPIDALPLDRYYWLHPIAFTNDGYIISAEMYLSLYNPKENVLRTFEFGEEESYFGSVTYVESHVSPYNNTNVQG